MSKPCIQSTMRTISVILLCALGDLQLWDDLLSYWYFCSL